MKFNLIILISFLFLLSCKKENKGIVTSTFMNELKVTSLICYPNDNISMTFVIISTNGKAPYHYDWITPDTFMGPGPFTLTIKSDTLLEVNVSDQNSTNTKFQYRIKKDTIDPLKYDYRNSFAGSYKCEVIYRWVTLDTNGVYQNHETTYQDTLDVKKSSDFRMLVFSNGIPDVFFNYTDNTFSGYHTSGHFNNDSIGLYYYLTPAAMYSYTYKGKKITNSTQ